MKTRLTHVGALALCFLLAACNKPAGGPPKMPPASVTVTQPVAREIVERDEYPGRFEAVDMVEVRARVSGYLQSINFKDGAEVKKGDLLFVIDPRQYQAELDRAEASAKEAQSRLELAVSNAQRADKLIKSKAMSQEEADTMRKGKSEAEAALQSAQATVETAKLNLEYTRITSPINGRIGRKLMTEGNLINGSQGQSSLLTTIVSMDPIYCSFDADELSVLKYQQLAREKKGEDFRDGKVVCEAELANETGFPHHGVLDFTDNQVDPATGTLRVRGIFPNPGPDRVLQPGFFARIRVPGSAKYQALLIPDQSVGVDQGQKFVYAVNTTNGQNIVEYRKVKLGPVFDGLRVVREGLQTSDSIIVTGLMSARPGAPVNITQPTNSITAAKP